MVMQRFPMKISVELVFAKPRCLDASLSIRPPPGLELDDNSMPLTPTRPTKIPKEIQAWSLSSRLGSDPMKIAVELCPDKPMDLEECKPVVIPFHGAQVPQIKELVPFQIDGRTGAAQTDGSSAVAPVQAPREISYAVLSNIPSRTQVSEVWRAIEARGFAGEVIGFSCPTRQEGSRNRTLNRGFAYVELADQGAYERFAAALSGCQFGKQPETSKVACVAFVYMDEHL